MQTLTEEQFKQKYGASAPFKIEQADNTRFPDKAAVRDPFSVNVKFTRAIGLGGATDVFGKLIARSSVSNVMQTPEQKFAAQVISDVSGQPEMTQKQINQTGLDAPTLAQTGGAIVDTAITAGSVAIPAIKPLTAAMAVGGVAGYVADVSSNFAEGQTGSTALTPGGETLAGLLIPPALRGLSAVAQKALAPSTEVLANSLKKNAKTAADVAEETPNKIKSLVKALVKGARFNLSDIDPQVETALKRSSTDEVNTYFQQAKNAALDTRKPTPLEIAGNKAEEAHDVISESIRKAGEGKRSILNEVADTRVSGNVINDTMSEGIQRIGEKYGVKIAADGTIEPLTGRVSKMDNVDSQLVSDYFNKLNKLGVSPSVREVDDFVDWAQGQLYKQSKSLSTLDAADKAVVSDLKQVTGSLNQRLKTEVGNGYGEVNARLSELLDMQDELSRALGADARKGGGLMKRLFSPTGGQTREMFDSIYRETGIDLDKEANLARFAMDSVGDVRQKSLLKQLDAGFKEASELDLTKPLSWIQFIRERADLDEQELANEIIRRSSSSK